MNEDHRSTPTLTSDVVDNQQNTTNLTPEKSLDEQISDIRKKMQNPNIGDAEWDKLEGELTKLRAQKNTLTI